jgi:hypothetical protein
MEETTAEEIMQNYAEMPQDEPAPQDDGENLETLDEEETEA